MKNSLRKLRERRGYNDVVKIGVGLLIFATLGVTAITLLETAVTAGWSSTVATIAITLTAILAALAVALSFFGKKM